MNANLAAGPAAQTTPWPVSIYHSLFVDNPYPLLAELRERDPVHFSADGIWLVTRHADVHALNKDPRFGRDLQRWMGYPLMPPYPPGSMLDRIASRFLINLDPPDHTRLRRLAARAFTPAMVSTLRGEIERIADELLESSIGLERFDVVKDFAEPLPVRVIARILSLPLERFAELKVWSVAIARVVEPTLFGRRAKEQADAAIRGMYEFLESAITTHSSREDFLGTLLAAEESGDRLDTEELLALLILLFVAGHETTTHLIGNGLKALLDHPNELARLRSEPALLPSAVEEMLRFDGPAHWNGRVAHEDLEIGGKPILAGQLLFAMLGGANRDPDVFSDPDRFDIARRPNPHLTFGGGAHHCLGAALARLEAQVAFERLLARFAHLKLLATERRPNPNIRGYEHLVVEVGA